jgi:hypothetical protein
MVFAARFNANCGLAALEDRGRVVDLAKLRWSTTAG